jgi:hypothetical protein
MVFKRRHHRPLLLVPRHTVINMIITRFRLHLNYSQPRIEIVLIEYFVLFYFPYIRTKRITSLKHP